MNLDFIFIYLYFCFSTIWKLYYYLDDYYIITEYVSIQYPSFIILVSIEFRNWPEARCSFDQSQ